MDGGFPRCFMVSSALGSPGHPLPPPGGQHPGQRLAGKGVHVVTIKPGFVGTLMTERLPQGFLFIPAERAGKLIHKACRSGRNSVYLPFRWWVIMTVIRVIPESVFKRSSL